MLHYQSCFSFIPGSDCLTEQYGYGPVTEINNFLVNLKILKNPASFLSPVGSNYYIIINRS